MLTAEKPQTKDCLFVYIGTSGMGERELGLERYWVHMEQSTSAKAPDKEVFMEVAEKFLSQCPR